MQVSHSKLRTRSPGAGLSSQVESTPRRSKIDQIMRAFSHGFRSLTWEIGGINDAHCQSRQDLYIVNSLIVDAKSVRIVST